MIFNRHKTIASCNEQWTVTRKVYEAKMLQIEMSINARRRLWIVGLANIMYYLFYCCILHIYRNGI